MSTESRRTFLEKLIAGSAVALGAPAAPGTHRAETLARRRRVAANDNIQIAVIGAGGMGVIDVNTALKIPGVALVGVCDLYDGRLATQEESENWPWDSVLTTRDYREILARDDVDAVIVATPDHWHRQISVDAMRAGKAVYCEKPMVHSIDEGAVVIAAQRETGRPFQVGSQGMSSLGNEKARELYRAGAIGELNYAEGFWARNSPNGAWQYAIPEDASEETVDWDRFLGEAPRLPFDPVRLFRWRNYSDYGTGVSGDLFVHLFSSLHSIIDSLGPTKIMATGGLRYWKDGRDAPDVVLGMFDYPEAETHPPFNLSLRCNFVDGTSGSTFLRLVGHEGSMDVTWTEVTVRKNKVSGPTDVFNQAKENEQAAQFGERKQMLPPAEMVYRAEEGYWGAHVDHFMNLFEGMRSGDPIVEDAVFGLRAAAPALACNNSLASERTIRWDPVNLRLVD
jgi:predicted dehydrogenase